MNRFDISGRSYKVIPQIQRVARLNADQLEDIYVTRAGQWQTDPAQHRSRTLRDSVTPRSLNRFQQLNAVKISGVAIRAAGRGVAVLGGRGGAGFCPSGYKLDYTGESRFQLRPRATNSFPRSRWRSS